jgi:hypothetical protein
MIMTDILKILKGYRTRYSFNDGDSLELVDMLCPDDADDITDGLLELEALAEYLYDELPALSDDGWTYCDDRPPEEQGWYIVSIQWADNEGINRRVRMDEFLKGVGFTKFSRHEIIAWRPLPEPAKGRDI